MCADTFDYNRKTYISLQSNNNCRDIHMSMGFIWLYVGN